MVFQSKKTKEFHDRGIICYELCFSGIIYPDIHMNMITDMYRNMLQLKPLTINTYVLQDPMIMELSLNLDPTMMFTLNAKLYATNIKQDSQIFPDQSYFKDHEPVLCHSTDFYINGKLVRLRGIYIRLLPYGVMELTFPLNTNLMAYVNTHGADEIIIKPRKLNGSEYDSSLVIYCKCIRDIWSPYTPGNMKTTLWNVHNMIWKPNE